MIIVMYVMCVMKVILILILILININNNMYY